MRPIKRFVLRASELAAALFGIVLSFNLGMIFDRMENALAPLTFCLGCVLTIVGLVLFRRKTRPWKINYDAVGWELSKTQRKLHPARARRKKMAQRILIWAPSAIAALVLFFYPVVTHLMHPRSQHLGHYRVPIPWTFAIFPWPGGPTDGGWVDVVVSSSGRGRFGMTPFLVPPFWLTVQRLSLFTFGSNPDANTFNVGMKEVTGKDAPQIREFRLGDVALTCWQYRPQQRYFEYWPESGFFLNVECETPAATRQQNFYARFYGREQDLGTFYQIIKGVTPVK
jgi:hypothetical protein